MKRSTDQTCSCSTDETSPGAVAAPATPAVLVVDQDHALANLIEEWLAAEGCRVGHEPLEQTELKRRFDLVIVDLPHARQHSDNLLQRISNEWPGTPILALSSSFFPGLQACGPVAHALGVSCVLAKPVTRLGLIAAVHQLLGRSAAMATK